MFIEIGNRMEGVTTKISPEKHKEKWARLKGRAIPCVHCAKTLGFRPRNLCSRCYNDMGIRNQHRPLILPTHPAHPP